LDISIIIVNLNTRQLLEACLASIYAYTCDVTFEVIVLAMFLGFGVNVLVYRVACCKRRD